VPAFITLTSKSTRCLIGSQWRSSVVVYGVYVVTLTFYVSVALLPVFLYAIMHAQNYTKQLLNVSVFKNIFVFLNKLLIRKYEICTRAA